MGGQRFKIRKMNIIPVSAFRDNYIWLLHNGKQAAVVDPGDAAPVQHFLNAHGLSLCAILITHHHADHTGGIQALTQTCPVPVFGPAAEAIAGVTHPLTEGDTACVPELALELQVISVPAHTAGHIAYYDQDVLFCGDTLFSAGCGRLFEGTPAQLQQALSKIVALGDDIQVYCTHEYTLSNLAFARAAEPDNPTRDQYAQHCEALRADNLPTLPTSIGLERQINPFLRTRCSTVIDQVAAHSGKRPRNDLECLTALRAWKDVF